MENLDTQDYALDVCTSILNGQRKQAIEQARDAINNGVEASQLFLAIYKTTDHYDAFYIAEQLINKG